ncbi:MAG: FHA domain-containing protein [Leptolyngbyaceae cyanobacterium]
MTVTPQAIKLTWTDPITKKPRSPNLTPPIAFGRGLEHMPATLDGQRVSRMVLESDRVSRYHALIQWEQGQYILTDQNTPNGTQVNGEAVQRCVLQEGDRIQIGDIRIRVQLETSASPALPPTQYRFSTIQIEDEEEPLSSTNDQPDTTYPDTIYPDTTYPDTTYPDTIHGEEDGIEPEGNPSRPISSATPGLSFPPPGFLDAQQVNIGFLERSGLFQQTKDEVDYAGVGAGLGNYIWVDYLRISGVKAHQIVALGTQTKPYAKYKQLCLNSQIPLHERLRSNSDSCPDNIWGWPSYAVRESWHELWRGRFDRAVKMLWQVFAEPTLAETYTPRAGNVFDSIDREAKRIGWEDIYRYGSVRAIRKTTDGRYAIAYSRGGGDYGYLVAKYVHLATGYPGIRFLQHLQDYRDQTQDLKSVVNAYEHHDHIYKQLEQQGGTAVIQGRGIVASRILQRLYEVRKTSGQNIEVVHLMRSPKQAQDGNRFGWAQRTVQNHWEYQPFNWPKACWGGDLRDLLEKTNPVERQTLMQAWGGTTTADRHDWQQIVAKGLQQKWYLPRFGSVQSVDAQAGKLQVTYDDTEHATPRTITQAADFIIDATGLAADVQESPLLNDLIRRYDLALLNNGKLSVSNEFELTEMQSPNSDTPQQGIGRMYAAGVMTLGGPYAAVDSFLGLQYAALRSVEHLVQTQAEGIKPLSAGRSLSQWFRWMRNKTP